MRRVAPEFTGTSPADTVRHTYGTDATPKLTYTETRDESGKRTRNYFDVFGNQVKTILGYGATEATTTTLAYDLLGRRKQVTDPRGLVTSYAPDTRGLLTSKSSPDAGTVQFKYDHAGNLRYSQDANQAAAGQVAFTTYDFAGRPLVSGQASATFSSLNPFTTAGFEGTTGNWLTVRQYDAKPTNVFPWSLFWTQISPLTLSNVTGKLTAVASKSNGAWQVTLFSYDPDGRVATQYTYTQNNAGSAVLTALNSTLTFTRDLRDAVTQRTHTVGSNTFYQWHDYNARGLLWRSFASTSATKPGTADVTYTYRPSGQVQDRQFSGGPLVPVKYTIREQMERIGDPATTTYPFSARYAYHANGTVSESEFYNAGSPATAKRYRYVFGTGSYDALNRLKSADFSHYSGGWVTTAAHDLANIGYDAAGNLTALQRYRETGTLIDNLTYSYPGSSNRLSSVADAINTTSETWDAEDGSFTYDANGNMKTAPAPYSVTAVTYDHQNLPISLTRSGTTTTYRYNEAGQRITKQVGSGSTEVYLLQGALTLAVYTVPASGTPSSWYFNVLAGEKVVGRQPNTGSRSYYHTDLLGSTRSVTQGTTVVESYDFEPWGLLMPGRTLGSGTKEGFTGKELDAETGLGYFGARYYMAALGRWGSVDPLAEKHGEWTPYNYVLNNPMVLIDPDGRQEKATGGCEKDNSCPKPTPPPTNESSTGSKIAVAAAIAIATPEPTTTIGGLALLGLTAAMIASSQDDAVSNTRTDAKTQGKPRDKVWVTYTLTNPEGQIYVGRTSGYGDAHSIVMRRFSGHHMRALGFGNPRVDRQAMGRTARSAVRGREQQLIDFYGGVGSQNVGNQIRAVARFNPRGLGYHTAASSQFGEVHPYTGYVWR